MVKDGTKNIREYTEKSEKLANALKHEIKIEKSIEKFEVIILPYNFNGTTNNPFSFEQEVKQKISSFKNNYEESKKYRLDGSNGFDILSIDLDKNICDTFNLQTNLFQIENILIENPNFDEEPVSDLIQFFPFRFDVKDDTMKTGIIHNFDEIVDKFVLPEVSWNYLYSKIEMPTQLFFSICSSTFVYQTCVNQLKRTICPCLTQFFIQTTMIVIA